MCVYPVKECDIPVLWYKWLDTAVPLSQQSCRVTLASLRHAADIFPHLTLKPNTEPSRWQEKPMRFYSKSEFWMLNDKSGSVMRAYLLKPSVFRGFALVMLGRNAVSTHHRKAFWSTEFIVNGTCGRTWSNVIINHIKCMFFSWKTPDFWTKVPMMWSSCSLLTPHWSFIYFESYTEVKLCSTVSFPSSKSYICLRQVHTCCNENDLPESQMSH